jgi:lipid A 3-O-deacylase
MLKRTLLTTICSLMLSVGVANAAEETLKERVVRDLPKTDMDFLTFTLENDSIGGGSDRNYTSGVRLTYFDYSADIPKLAHFLDKYVPTFGVNETTSVYYSFGQNLYTPENITARTPDPQDRPYAAFLYASAGLTTLSENHIDDVEVTIGIVGPWALGEETQKNVHEIVESDDPKGWDHQLDNEPGVILSWQRLWPSALTGDIGSLYFRAAPHTGITLGNIYTYGAAGLSLQIAPKKYRLQSAPTRVRPAIPGNGFFAVPDNKFAWSVFAGVEERAMARNIFLDGNSFTDSPSVDKRIMVTDANAGISFIYGRARISYTLNWRSREFEGQSEPSLFGALSLGYRF